MKIYPLKFEPFLVEKVWGGRALTRLGKNLPAEESVRIGESWELADLPESAGGVSSIISNGPLRGKTLHGVIEQFGPRLLGRLQCYMDGCFPLLVKFIDAESNLSIQVHPTHEYALHHPGVHAKSEAWYILSAEPGAVIYKGLKQEVSPEEFAESVRTGTIADLLLALPARPGECHFLPAGTCHALGAGVVVAEIQTPSDTTFRLHDWGRQGRELHIEQALECVNLQPTDTRQQEKRSHIAGVFTTISRLITADDFQIERIRMSEGYAQEIPYDQPAVWLVLEGGGRIELADEQVSEVSFTVGDTLLIPAGMNDAKLALNADTCWLEVQFPQTKMDLIA